MRRILLLACLAGLLAGQTDLRFEVASIKRSDPKGGGGYKRFACDSTHCSAAGMALAGLVFEAYGLKESYQFEAAAQWMSSEHYDIDAKVPDGAAIEQDRAMLQRLLAERLGLAVHRVTRQLPGFRLVVAKDGPKLKKSVDAPVADNNAKSGIRLTVEEEQIRGRHETMGGLAHQLVQALHGPVIDATGIEGEYDYDFSFEPIVAPLPKGAVIIGVAPPHPGTPPQASDPAGGNVPTIFTAIRQLGLQLESVKSIPVEVVVLDSANREPTAN